MNKIFLKGHLGQDPTVRIFEWGKVANVSLATTENYKNKAGEKITETEWHYIVFRGPTAEVVEKHLKKGSEILVVGKKKTREYTDKDGIKRTVCEIYAESFEFCGSAPKKEEDSKPQSNGQWQGAKPQTTAPKTELAQGPDGFPDAPGQSEIDDLPF